MARGPACQGGARGLSVWPRSDRRPSAANEHAPAPPPPGRPTPSAAPPLTVVEGAGALLRGRRGSEMRREPRGDFSTNRRLIVNADDASKNASPRDYGSKGWGFESSWAHHSSSRPLHLLLVSAMPFRLVRLGSMNSVPRSWVPPRSAVP